jgi:hypothetical protein
MSNPKFTQGHYDVLGEVLRHQYQVAQAHEFDAVEMVEQITENLAAVFEQDNERFLRGRWYLRIMGRTTRVKPGPSKSLDPFRVPEGVIS